MKDKQGEKVTTKEFFQRWKKGIQAVTPLQQAKVSFVGSVFVLAGVIFGLVTTFITQIWWLFIILLGSLLLTSMAFLGNIQKYLVLKKMDEAMKGGNNDKIKESTI